MGIFDFLVSNVAKSPSNDFEEELNKCQQYAREGYRLADSQYREIVSALKSESSKIKSASQEQNSISRVKNTELMEQQQLALNELANYIDKIHSDIQMLHNNQKEFTIIVYGRTMAGKSTLMEILTHGNGQYSRCALLLLEKFKNL